MRMLLQRVTRAQVTVDDQVCGKIGPGLLVFLAVHQSDEASVIPWMVQKLVNLRIFGDEAGKMNLSLKDVGGSALVVSQFTLYGNCMNGRRPDFFSSAKGPEARQLYEDFVRQLKTELSHVETGRFAAHMQIELVNDGPVTLLVDSKTTD